MKRWLVLGGSVLGLALAGHAVWCVQGYAFVHDTQYMVASEAAHVLSENPSASQTELYSAVTERLRFLRDASVTHAWFDSSGALVDPWRSRFAIVVHVVDGRTVVTCHSLVLNDAGREACAEASGAQSRFETSAHPVACRVCAAAS